MTFDPINNPVDFATLGGQRTPGICTVVDAKWPRRIIERSGIGLSGATARFGGVMLSDPALQIRLYNEQDFADWASFLPVVAAPPLGEHARALDIDHPILADFQITAVLIKDVHQPVDEGEGVWMAQIDLKQFRRPNFQMSAPDGAATGPTDPLDIENDALAAEATRLAAPGTT